MPLFFKEVLSLQNHTANEVLIALEQDMEDPEDTILYDNHKKFMLSKINKILPNIIHHINHL